VLGRIDSLAESVEVLVGPRPAFKLPVCEIAHWLQPVVDQSETQVVDGGASSATPIVPTDNDVLLTKLLQLRQSLEILFILRFALGRPYVVSAQKVFNHYCNLDFPQSQNMRHAMMTLSPEVENISANRSGGVASVTRLENDRGAAI
jgi:hypothetical protein